jgi:hypothetical protein
MAELIEYCFTITTKRFRKDLELVREHRKNISGYIDIKHGTKVSVSDYSVEYGMEYDYLVIHNEGVEQRIKLIDGQLKFGTRIWFICECGAHIAKLYLPPGCKEFKCRRCHHLCYQSTRINKNSKHGRFLYKESLVLKIIAMRESMGRIFYRSEYTKRFKRWLNLCDKAGLTNERGNANNLMGGISGFR